MGLILKGRRAGAMNASTPTMIMTADDGRARRGAHHLRNGADQSLRRNP